VAQSRLCFHSCLTVWKIFLSKLWPKSNGFVGASFFDCCLFDYCLLASGLRRGSIVGVGLLGWIWASVCFPRDELQDIGKARCWWWLLLLLFVLFVLSLGGRILHTSRGDRNWSAKKKCSPNN